MRCGATITFDEFLRYAERAGAYDPRLALAVAVRESFDAGWSMRNRLLCADQTGPVDECGIMQIRPSTAKFITGVDMSCEQLMRPSFNVAIGVRYLNYLIDYFHGDVRMAVAAYNAGPDRVRQSGRIPNPAYVDGVFRYYAALGGGAAPEGAPVGTGTVEVTARPILDVTPWVMAGAVGLIAAVGVWTIVRNTMKEEAY